MDVFPDPTISDFEYRAALCICHRLKLHGSAPWSICEARLSENEYQHLRNWAATVTVADLNVETSSVALVLLAFIAEWNRRNSLGDTVWVGLPPLFEVVSARQRLFTANGGPTQFLYRTMRKACEYFQLRHVKEDEEESQRYYLSIQLQYGFSLPHALDQLGNWLRGHQAPEVARRLLESDGNNRSASFRRLVRDMKSYRRNYLPESDFRRTLHENSWVLPAWGDAIVTVIDGIPRYAIEEEPEFSLLSDPRVNWETEPQAWCRVSALPNRLSASRYVLRCGGKTIARYYRQRDDTIESDRCEAQIPLDRSEAIVTLETLDGEAAEVQTVRLWDPKLVAQVRPVGREAEEASQHLLHGEQVLITSVEAAVTPAPSAWFVFGQREQQRRWSLIDGMRHLQVEDDGVVWNGEPPPPPPVWTNGVSVVVEPAHSFYQLGESIRFRIYAPQNVEVAHVSCAGLPLSFADSVRTRTAQVPIRAEMSGQCHIRVGLTHRGDSAVVHRDVTLPIRTVTWADDGLEISRSEPLSCFEAMYRPVRLLSNGPTVLAEGREIFGPLPIGRVSRIRRVLGTGKELIVADYPFNTRDHFLLAHSALDTGFARSLDRIDDRFRLRLFRAIAPGARHRLFLWSPDHGMTITTEISPEEGGYVWTFRSTWETDTLLAAVAYEGSCIASSWCGQERRFFDPAAADGADVLTRIALIRWCRFPGLKPDPESPKQLLIDQFQGYPVQMVRVAMLDEGLPSHLELVFEDRQSRRGELFNVIFREAFVRLTSENVAEVFDQLPSDFNRLLTFHPLLSCRALLAVLPKLIQQSGAQTRALLVAMRLQLLSLGGNPSSIDLTNREEELLIRARGTFDENGKPMDEYAVRSGLIEPIIHHLFDKTVLNIWHEENLRTALGVAPFREYLAAMILRRMLEQLP